MAQRGNRDDRKHFGGIHGRCLIGSRSGKKMAAGKSRALTFDQPSGRTDLVSLGDSATAGLKSARWLAALKWIHMHLS
jgi:hypothetical protein